jgi:hypothetical protein
MVYYNDLLCIIYIGVNIHLSYTVDLQTLYYVNEYT